MNIFFYIDNLDFLSWKSCKEFDIEPPFIFISRMSIWINRHYSAEDWQSLSGELNTIILDGFPRWENISF